MSGPSERTAQARPGAPKTALQTSDALTSHLAPAGTDDVIQMTSTRKERVARERASRERVECLSMTTRRPFTPLNHSDRPRVTQSTYAVTGRRESSTLDLFLLNVALALNLCFNVELVHHGHRCYIRVCHESFEGQAGVSQQDVVSDAVCQRLRRRSGGQMVDLSSEWSVAQDDVAPSTHALGLGAARGAVRRRWLKKEKVKCTGHNKPGALFVTFA